MNIKNALICTSLSVGNTFELMLIDCQRDGTTVLRWTPNEAVGSSSPSSTTCWAVSQRRGLAQDCKLD